MLSTIKYARRKTNLGRAANDSDDLGAGARKQDDFHRLCSYCAVPNPSFQADIRGKYIANITSERSAIA